MSFDETFATPNRNKLMHCHLESGYLKLLKSINERQDNSIQGRIQNTVKHLRWSVLRK